MKTAFFATAVSAFAAVVSAGWCISESAADTLVQRYADVIAQRPSDIGSPTATAEFIAAVGYFEESDSANINIGLPLGGKTATSKQAFVQESQANKPLDATTIAIYVACDVITWQWVSLNFGTYEVKGIHVFHVNSAGKLTAAYFEFNSIAGALDNGYSVLTPNGTELVVVQ